MERLTERSALGVCGNNEKVKYYPLYAIAASDPLDYGIIGACFNKLADYEDAEENGLLLRLPCPIGTELYSIYGAVHKLIRKDFPQIQRVYMGESNIMSIKRHFGKTIFLTREEAEKALAERGK